MSDSFITLPNGQKLDTTQATVNTQTVQRQRLVLASPTDPDELAEVVDGKLQAGIAPQTATGTIDVETDSVPFDLVGCGVITAHLAFADGFDGTLAVSVSVDGAYWEGVPFEDLTDSMVKWSLPLSGSGDVVIRANVTGFKQARVKCFGVASGTMDVAVYATPGTTGPVASYYDDGTGKLKVTATNLTVLPDPDQTTVDVTFEEGQDTSTAVDLGSRRLVGIVMPSIPPWTAAPLSFLASWTGIEGPYVHMMGTDGAYLSTAVMDKENTSWLALEPADFAGVRYLQIRSGTADAVVAQESESPLTLVLRRI